MKKILIVGMILLLTGCTIIIKPDCKCECFPNSWYWQSETYPVMPTPMPGVPPYGILTPNDFTLPNLERYEFKIN
jgi:hypothetical protein